MRLLDANKRDAGDIEGVRAASFDLHAVAEPGRIPQGWRVREAIQGFTSGGHVLFTSEVRVYMCLCTPRAA